MTKEMERAIKAMRADDPVVLGMLTDKELGETLKAALTALDSPSDAVVEAAAIAIGEQVEAGKFLGYSLEQQRKFARQDRERYAPHARAAIRAYLAAIRGESK